MTNQEILDILNQGHSKESTIPELLSEEDYHSFLLSIESEATEWFKCPGTMPNIGDDAKIHVQIPESVLSQVKTQAQIDEEIEEIREKERQKNQKKLDRQKRREEKEAKKIEREMKKKTKKKSSSKTPKIPKKVNLNSVSLETLCALPLMGTTKAERIIAARPFHSIEEVLKIPGVGKGFFDKIKNLLTIE